MKGLDLQDLIVLIDECYIQLRKKLGFEELVTFGFELEFEQVMESKLYERISEAFSNDSWFTFLNNFTCIWFNDSFYNVWLI